LAVCTPNGLHATHSILALEHGIHVLCEKPMSIRSVDCKAMIATAEKANKKLFIVKQNRYNPPVAAVKNLIDNNKLGKIYSVHVSCIWNRNTAYYDNAWRGTKNLDGGILFTQYSHFIDLLYYLIGDVSHATSLLKKFTNKNIEFEDSGVAMLAFENGAIGSIHFSVNAHYKNMEGSITILAEKGTVKIGGEYLNTLEYQNIDNYSIDILDKPNLPNDYGTYKGSMSNHDKVYTNIIDVLLHGKNMTTSSYEGLKTVEIIEKIYGI
jgi:UDP-N-acetyl-2-amino-2-deoxyglucuronate dehydrogenase